MSSAILEVQELRKCYGDVTALAGVSFAVADGEMFGLLGPNGAGKTTLLSIISSLLEPTAGSVQLLGRRLTGGDRDVRRLIGIVPQELALYGELTAAENVSFFGRLYGLSGEPLQRRVAEVLEWVGLQDRANERARTFSGGMQRRLNLGLGLVHEPRLLLLDEPTTGVDPQSRNHIFREVRRLNTEGLTVVYTSHYMEEVQALCPRIGIMDHGRLIACDSLAGLLRQHDGLIRFRVAQLTPALRERLKQLPNTRLTEQAAPELELHCRDVKTALVQLVSLLKEMGVELTGLETEEPNLERVFLHLTGRELRD
jgi:ABC-2 type transport system ATP-binding protein